MISSTPLTALALVLVTTLLVASTYARPPQSQWTPLLSNRKSCGKFPFDQCSFTDNFRRFNRQRWMVHHDNFNRQPFDSWWSKHQVRVLPAWGKLKLSIGNRPKHGKNFASAQILTKKWYGYGCYQIRMKPISVPGVLSTFFIYTGEFDAAPGRPKNHSEIDIEFVYRTKLKKVVLQSNYFANSKGHNEKFHFPKFTPHEDFHNYGFKFTKKSIEWYADGTLLRTATRNIPQLKDGPFRIFMNIWVAGRKAHLWAGRYKHRKNVGALYDKIQYTKGQDCVIGETF